jgi:hypothetical protein
MRRRTFFLAPAFALTFAIVASPEASARGNFFNSNDYRDDDEVVGKMLVDDDYRKMVEDLEYRNVSWDWGWVKGTGKKANKPKTLAFSSASYKTVFIAPVTNPSHEVVPGLTGEVHELFEATLKEIGLDLVSSEKKADLVLKVAVVDYNPNSIYVYFTWIDPFIELELKLSDAKTGEDLLLIRHQDHGSTPLDGAADTALDLAKFIR